MNSFITSHQKSIKSAIAASTVIAEYQATKAIEKALREMRSELDFELQRLTEMRRRNSYIRQQEIDFIADQKQQLTKLIQRAAPRLDAVRLIIVRQGISE